MNEEQISGGRIVFFDDTVFDHLNRGNPDLATFIYRLHKAKAEM